MDGQLKNCEKPCDFLGKEYEDQKKELQTAKSNISGLQKRCNDLEDKCKDYSIVLSFPSSLLIAFTVSVISVAQSGLKFICS